MEFFDSPEYQAALAKTAGFRQGMNYVLVGIGVFLLIGSLLSVERIHTPLIAALTLSGYWLGRIFYLTGTALAPSWVAFAAAAAAGVCGYHTYFYIRAKIARTLAIRYSAQPPSPVVSAQALSWMRRNDSGFRRARVGMYTLVALAVLSGLYAKVELSPLMPEVAIFCVVSLACLFARIRAAGYSRPFDLATQVIEIQLNAIRWEGRHSGWDGVCKTYLGTREGHTWLTAMAKSRLIDLGAEEGVSSLARALQSAPGVSAHMAREVAVGILDGWRASLPHPKMFGICSEAA